MGRDKGGENSADQEDSGDDQPGDRGTVPAKPLKNPPWFIGLYFYRQNFLPNGI
jgi:hypothetical protein